MQYLILKLLTNHFDILDSTLALGLKTLELQSNKCVSFFCFRLQIRVSVQFVHSSCFKIGFTGIDQVYEAPKNPDLSLTTVSRSIKETMNEVITLLEANGIIPRAANDRVSELMVAPEKKEEFIKEAEAHTNFIRVVSLKS